MPLVFSEKAQARGKKHPASVREGSLQVLLLPEYRRPRHQRPVSFSLFTLIKHPSSALPGYPGPTPTRCPRLTAGRFFLTSFSGETSAEEKASLTGQLDFFPTSFTSSQQQSCQLLTVFLFECKREWRKPLDPTVHTQKPHSRPPSLCFLA